MVIQQSRDEPVIKHAAFSAEITDKCDAWANEAPPSGSISFPHYAGRSTAAMAQIATIKIPATGRTIELPTGLFINNEFVPSVDSQETLRCVISV